MPETATTWSVAAIIAVLRACRWVTACSLILTAAATCAWAQPSGWLHAALAATIIACGLGALWFGFRIEVDKNLFRHLQGQAQESLHQMDEAFEKLGWMRHGLKGRSLAGRIDGAMKLVRRQIGLTLAQGLLWIAVWLTTPLLH